MAVKGAQKMENPKEEKVQVTLCHKSFWGLVGFLWVCVGEEHVVDIKVWNIYSGLD